MSLDDFAVLNYSCLCSLTITVHHLEFTGHKTPNVSKQDFTYTHRHTMLLLIDFQALY